MNCSYRFAARDGLTKPHLQECLTANNSRNKPDIDVNFVPQCLSQSKDAETCKKSKSEIFALMDFLHPTDELSVQLVCKISHLCDHNPPTSQTDGQTDDMRSQDRAFALKCIAR